APGATTPSTRPRTASSSSTWVRLTTSRDESVRTSGRLGAVAQAVSVKRSAPSIDPWVTQGARRQRTECPGKDRPPGPGSTALEGRRLVLDGDLLVRVRRLHELDGRARRPVDLAVVAAVLDEAVAVELVG